MVRRNRSPLSGLSDAEIKAMAAQLRAAFRELGILRAADDANHEPDMTTHRHYHFHPDGDAPGLDSDSGHSHKHSHGKAPDALAPPQPDNDHEGHVHDPLDWEPGQWPGPYERPPDGPESAPQQSPYGRHIRFERGQARELAAQPGRVYNRAAVDAAWARTARSAARIERRYGR